MTEPSDNPDNRKERLKQLIKRLHEGAKVEEVKAQFRELVAGVSPAEIAQIEEELIKEGMPAEEVHRLCDVHLAAFQESLERAKPEVPAGHPVSILMNEHTLLVGYANKLREVANALSKVTGFDGASEQLEQIFEIVGHLKDSASHYLREENVLFPYLEKHGITQPPAIMWMEHDKIREIEKNLYALIDRREKLGFKKFLKQLEEVALVLAEMLSDHFYKENNILFPTGLKVINAQEWQEVRLGFDDIGYCSFTPTPPGFSVLPKPVLASKSGAEGQVPFETGALSPENIEAIFDTLPVDITFVDKEDTVRYFSQSKERIFVRSKAVIGRNVKACHPQKSLHAVNQILDDFKAGKRDFAEFWINLKGRLIYIRYFPVRNKDGEYQGCLEVTQDITDIKGIEGEKRLLSE